MAGLMGVLLVGGVRSLIRGCIVASGGHTPTDSARNGNGSLGLMSVKKSKTKGLNEQFIVDELLRFWHSMSHYPSYLNELREFWKAQSEDRDSPYREAYRLALKRTEM